MSQIEFKEAYFFSHKDVVLAKPSIKFHKVPRLRTIDDYNRFVLFELGKSILTSHALIVQSDSYVLDADAWDSRFLEFDYIGAPWPVRADAYRDPWGRPQRVGNGGFSLRSKRLMQLPSIVEVPYDVNSSDFYQHMNAGLNSEDGNICVHNRHIFESHGCVFAPIEIASRFSRELEIIGLDQSATFGFHRYRKLGGRAKRAPWYRGFYIPKR